MTLHSSKGWARLNTFFAWNKQGCVFSCSDVFLAWVTVCLDFQSSISCPKHIFTLYVYFLFFMHTNSLIVCWTECQDGPSLDTGCVINLHLCQFFSFWQLHEKCVFDVSVAAAHKLLFAWLTEGICELQIKSLFHASSIVWQQKQKSVYMRIIILSVGYIKTL